MKAVLLNAPPEAGKDTIGEMLEEGLEMARTVKFAQPIIDYMENTFGVSCQDGENKNAPCDALVGQSRRQVAINYSELFMKPTFGDDIFGLMAMDYLREAAVINEFHTAIFTDSGFETEARVLRSQLGPQNLLHIKIHRPGYDYNGDSRSYWNLPDVRVVDFDNNCETVGELFNVVRAGLRGTIKQWLDQ